MNLYSAPAMVGSTRARLLMVALVGLISACGTAVPAGSSSPTPTASASALVPAPSPSEPPLSASTSPSTAPSAPPSTAGEGVTGTWLGTWQNGPNWGTANGGFTMQITQAGKTFLGTIDVTGPTCIRHGTVSGTVNGSSISFGFVATGVRDIQYDGTVNGDQMSGTWTAEACDVTVQIDGSWAASRTK